MKRVAITGIGIVSPIGSSVEAFSERLNQGMSGFSRIGFGRGGRLKPIEVSVAQVDDFEPAKLFDDRQIPVLDRVAQFAVCAGREAVRDSGLLIGEREGRDVGVVLGVGFGSGISIEESYRQYFVEERRPHPLLVPKAMINSAAAHVSMTVGARGPTYVMSSACASASHAIGHSFDLVRHGAVRAVITGGAEAPLTEGMIRAWDGLRVMSPDICRPFSAGRRGMLLGEGAAVLVLEDLDLAIRRGARIYAEVVGYGASSDAENLTTPTIEGPMYAMQSCMSSAGLEPSAIDYINAHGTGTLANDRTETSAIRRALGKYADAVSVSSTKSMHGHALGASGALEAVAAVCAIRNSIIPPTINYSGADPECDLNYTPNEAVKREVNVALSNSFAFGGHNAVLAFKRYY